MKKKFILAIFGVSLLFAACQQDSLCDDYVIDDQKSSVLREMKTLINDNYNAVTLLDWERTLNGNGSTRSGGECNSLMLTKEDFGFDWDNADVVTSNLAEAVIVPVKLNRDIALRSVVMEGNRRKKETTPIQSMLYACKIYKTGKTRAYILSFAPNRDYINECEEKGEELKLCPNPQGTNFSGILFYSTIYGEVSHGIRYEHGRKRYYIIPRSERNIGFIEQYHSEHCDNHECDSTYSHVKMAVEFITIATTTRSTYSNNSEGAEMLTCSFCGKDVEECTCLEIVACGICKKDPCECNNGDDNVEAKCDYCGFPLEFCQCNNSPSWGDDSGSHGPNPGSPYPGGNIIGGNSGGNSGNGGSTLVTPSEAVLQLGKISATITGTNIERLNSSLDLFIENPYYKRIYELLSKKNPNITFAIEPIILDGEKVVAAFLYEKNKIIFYDAACINEQYLREELIHAAQYHCFDNERFSYSKGNIELEAKMIKDMISHLTYNCCNTCLTQFYEENSSLISNYVNWLLGEFGQPKDYSNYDYWYKLLLTDFNYPKSPVNPNDTSHVLLDKFYEIIQTVEAEKNENN